jgi:hypothetical protein
MFKFYYFAFLLGNYKKNRKKEKNYRIEKNKIKVYCRSISDSNAGTCSGKDLRSRISVKI